jgi:hypothetical protein
MPFQDPVSTIHGRVYEREAIEAWFRHSRTDPMTGERLLNDGVVLNNGVVCAKVPSETAPEEPA